jgi:hypothetical protein
MWFVDRSRIPLGRHDCPRTSADSHTRNGPPVGSGALRDSATLAIQILSEGFNEVHSPMMFGDSHFFVVAPSVACRCIGGVLCCRINKLGGDCGGYTAHQIQRLMSLFLGSPSGATPVLHSGLLTDILGSFDSYRRRSVADVEIVTSGCGRRRCKTYAYGP